MDCRLNRWRRIAAVLIGGWWCVALAASGCHRKPNQPNIDSLREALQRTATFALPSPSLVNRRFAIAVPADKIQEKASEIASIGGELKGTVLPTPTSNSGASLLISLPGNRVVEFATRALGQSLPPEDELDRPVLVEVTITPIPPSR